MALGFEKLSAKVTESLASSDLPCLICCKKTELKQVAEKLQIEANLEQLHDSYVYTLGQKSFIFLDLKEEGNPYKIGSSIANRLQKLSIDRLSCVLNLDDHEILNAIEACMLKYPNFIHYKSKQASKPKEITFLVSEKGSAEKVLQNINHIVQNVLYVRRLVNMPSNHKRPSEMASEAYKLEDLKVKCKVLQGEDIKEMQCLTGVGQASTDKSKLIVLEWLPRPDREEVVALVGKGITFDSGGLSIKPAEAMEEMKDDMAGGATVMGIIRAAAQMQLDQNLVGIIPCAENMVSGDSLRPGDILKSYSGQTVEVLNTDAEGRLILADALSYVQTKYRPKLIMDLATLTGAIRVALGNVLTGVFCNDDETFQAIDTAGHRVWERVWRMPLGPEYDELINSDIADMKNISSGRGAGSVTAAQFLQRFVNPGTKWAHFDIAGTAYTGSSSGVFHSSMASGVCLRLILEMLADMS